MLKIARYYEREYLNDNSSIANEFEKYFNQQEQPKTVESMVEDLAKRTGLTQYINLVNAELENVKSADEKVLDSLLEIKEVKEAVDEALDRKQYSATVDLLKKLHDQIKFNSKIPEYLKNTFSDSKLKEYVDNKIKENKKDDYDKIDLLIKDKQDHNDQNQEPYFNFENEAKK